MEVAISINVIGKSVHRLVICRLSLRQSEADFPVLWYPGTGLTSVKVAWQVKLSNTFKEICFYVLKKGAVIHILKNKNVGGSDR